MVVQENKIYGACCIEHMEKVREGKQLKRIAVACEDGIDYTIKQSKQTYSKHYCFPYHFDQKLLIIPLIFFLKILLLKNEVPLYFFNKKIFLNYH